MDNPFTQNLIMYCCLKEWFPKGALLGTMEQVIGNKWDTYLDLLQADYSEGYVQAFPSKWLLFVVMTVPDDLQT